MTYYQDRSTITLRFRGIKNPITFDEWIGCLGLSFLSHSTRSSTQTSVHLGHGVETHSEFSTHLSMPTVTDGWAVLYVVWFPVRLFLVSWSLFLSYFLVAGREQAARVDHRASKQHQQQQQHHQRQRTPSSTPCNVGLSPSLSISSTSRLGCHHPLLKPSAFPFSGRSLMDSEI